MLGGGGAKKIKKGYVIRAFCKVRFFSRAWQLGLMVGNPWSKLVTNAVLGKGICGFPIAGVGGLWGYYKLSTK